MGLSMITYLQKQILRRFLMVVFKRNKIHADDVCHPTRYNWHLEEFSMQCMLNINPPMMKYNWNNVL